MELPPLNTDTVWAILNNELDDDTVNALVWRSLNYRYDVESDAWDASTADEGWNEMEPPNFIGSRPATIKLTRSIPKEHKQLLKEQLNFQGYQIHELTPQKTRRATAANWLLHKMAEQGEQANNGRGLFYNLRPSSSMYLPAMRYAIGSSYLIRQTAGSERFGGVTVKIGPRSAETGRLTVVASDQLNDEPIDDDIQFLVDGAHEGVQKFAADNAIDLSNWDITISRFAYHPVDSRQRMAKTAAYDAMASAFASWRRMGLGVRDD